MSGSDLKKKKSGAMIWLLGIVVVIVIGATIQDKPIIIAAGDNPPSISMPVTSFDASESGSLPPFGQPGTQIFYGGWNPPQ